MVILTVQLFVFYTVLSTIDSALMKDWKTNLSGRRLANQEKALLLWSQTQSQCRTSMNIGPFPWLFFSCLFVSLTITLFVYLSTWSSLPKASLITCHNRFRSNEGLEDKPIWEQTGKPGEGIVPLETDTETVQNINDHRYNEAQAPFVCSITFPEFFNPPNFEGRHFS